eukprot:3354317-Pyramimonas_sp.AAC.1
MYKLLASLLLGKLQHAGAEERLTSTQFGFRRKRGTSDAVHAVRRHVEIAHAQRDGKIALLALDWKKAFDSINVLALLEALGKFGVPDNMLSIIGSIYENRNFCVAEGSKRSQVRNQLSGIAQGCPLSPFLFVMVMSVVIKRAEDKLGEDALRSLRDGETSILLYADDTLLVGKHETYLQHVLDAIAEAGAEIGMELHWNKFQLLQTGCDISLRDPNGNIIKASGKMQYLGASIYSDGKLKHELSKRLGAAWGEFQRYARAWKHTAVSTRRKLQLFGALITSKVMYSFNSAWLNKQERRRLDGFQAR